MLFIYCSSWRKKKPARNNDYKNYGKNKKWVPKYLSNVTYNNRRDVESTINEYVYVCVCVSIWQTCGK